jgi:GDPmannose 4,6-dehydratase
VRQFIEMAAAALGISIAFRGQGLEEIAVVERIQGDLAPCLKTWDVITRVDPRYFRPSEVETLLGDPSLAKSDLGWVPEITLADMVKEMVTNDLVVAQRDALLKKHGYQIVSGSEV